MRSSNGCNRRSALTCDRGGGTDRGGSTGRGGCTDRGDVTDKGRRRRLHPRPEAMPSASIGHAWIREEIERVERFSSSGKGMK